MTSDKLHGYSKKKLADMARKHGIAGWHAMDKDHLITALLKHSSKVRIKRIPAVKKKVAVARPKRSAAPRRIQPQLTAARNTNGNGTTAEEQVKRSKFDVGIPTKDLSAKVPKNFPAGYGKDRIVGLVRV